MENQEKYWKDYAEFINLAENSTGLSPSGLIDHYETLVTELETNKSFEWIYENMETESTITKIHKLLNHDLLKENILKDQFKEKINEFDKRMKKFLTPSVLDDKNWWLDFTGEKIDCQKLNDE